MKQVSIILALFMMLSGSTCFARISTAQCFLGDLTVGTSIAEAQRIYGKPVRTTGNGSIRKYIYGDGSF